MADLNPIDVISQDEKDRWFDRMTDELASLGAERDGWRLRAEAAQQKLDDLKFRSDHVGYASGLLERAEQAEGDLAAVREALEHLLHAYTRMPDAGLTEGDPRYAWWYETASVRQRARDALDTSAGRNLARLARPND